MLGSNWIQCGLFPMAFGKIEKLMTYDLGPLGGELEFPSRIRSGCKEPLPRRILPPGHLY